MILRPMHVKNQPQANVSLSNGMCSEIYLRLHTLKFGAYGLFNLLNAVVWFVFTLFGQEIGRF